MIVVTISMWSARTLKQWEIGRLVIVNTGDTDDPKRGDYTVSIGRRALRGRAPDPDTVIARPLRTAEVKNYPRLSYNVWRLVLRALRAAFPEERR